MISNSGHVSFCILTILMLMLHTYLSHQGPSEAVVPTIMPFHWELFFFKRMMIGWWLTNQIRFLKHADWQPTTDQSRGSSRRGGLPPIGSCFSHFSLPGGQRDVYWNQGMQKNYLLISVDSWGFLNIIRLDDFSLDSCWTINRTPDILIFGLNCNHLHVCWALFHILQTSGCFSCSPEG